MQQQEAANASKKPLSLWNRLLSCFYTWNGNGDKATTDAAKNTTLQSRKSSNKDVRAHGILYLCV